MDVNSNSFKSNSRLVSISPSYLCVVISFTSSGISSQRKFYTFQTTVMKDPLDSKTKTPRKSLKQFISLFRNCFLCMWLPTLFSVFFQNRMLWKCSNTAGVFNRRSSAGLQGGLAIIIYSQFLWKTWKAVLKNRHTQKKIKLKLRS